MSLTSPRGIAMLEFETFEPLIGTNFALSSTEDGEAQATLKLGSAKLHGEVNPFGRRPFSLIFEGDASQEIPQGSFWFKNPRFGSQLVFIVPVGADASGRRYEAVFN